MFRYLRALWYFVTGRFQAAADALQTNPHVMAATYDSAISNQEKSLEVTKNAVAELISVEQSRVREIENLTKKVGELAELRQGAKVAMQRRIDDLRKQGQDKSSIMSDPEFLRHKNAYEKLDLEYSQKESLIDEKEEDVENLKKQVSVYKQQLVNMQRDNQSLKQEKSEAIADVQIAKQQERINSVLAGISTDSVDRDLQAAREARNRAKSRATVASELAGADNRLVEDQYKQYAASDKTSSELDNLLDWGEESASPQEDAQIPE